MSEPLTWAYRLNKTIAERNSILCVGLDPIFAALPAEFQLMDVAEGIFTYNRLIIDSAAHHAAAFKPQYKCYSAVGGAGLRALAMTCDYIKTNYPDIFLILDAKYSDVGHVVERCAHEAYTLYGVDAVTAMPAPGREALSPLLSRQGRGCFMVVRTSNPGAAELQDIKTSNNNPLYVDITRIISGGWSGEGSCGLVAPATNPQVLANVRAAAPALPILCPGVGAQGGDVLAAVAAGLDENGTGLLINVSRAIMEAADPGAAALEWRDIMNKARSAALDRLSDASPRRGEKHPEHSTTAESESSAAAFNSELRSVVIQLYRIGAIKFEPVTLKSGLVSPYYNNLRLLSSFPDLLKSVARLMAKSIHDAGITPDIWVGIAMAGIPLAVAISQETGIPAGYVRADAKAYGSKKMVEGAWHTGARAVLVDDVISDGASKLEVLQFITDAGLQVSDIAALVDRGQGGSEFLLSRGLTSHVTITMNTILDILKSEGLITDKEVDDSIRFMHLAKEQLLV